MTATEAREIANKINEERRRLEDELYNKLRADFIKLNIEFIREGIYENAKAGRYNLTTTFSNRSLILNNDYCLSPSIFDEIREVFIKEGFEVDISHYGPEDIHDSEGEYELYIRW